MSAAIPHLFRCPISLDLFTDPVTLCTGQTYDRPSIERWLAAGNLTCPVTMQRLPDATLVPNHTLRQLIDRWLLSALNAVSVDRPEKRLQAVLAMVQSLVEESDTARARLLRLGFLPLLLRLLFAGAPPPGAAAAAALACVGRLAAAAPAQAGHLNVLLEGGRMSAMLEMLERGGAEVQAGLCGVISAAAGSPATAELCLAIGREGRAVRALASLLAGGAAAPAAARAVAGLCAAGGNREAAVREGAVEALVGYAAGAGRGSRDAAAALERLAGVEPGRAALLACGSGVRVVVKMVFAVSADAAASEHAVGCLWACCCASARARAEAVRAGALPQLLLLLQSQCGVKAKAKARALLKLLSSSAFSRSPT